MGVGLLSFFFELRLLLCPTACSFLSLTPFFFEPRRRTEQGRNISDQPRKSVRRWHTVPANEIGSLHAAKAYWRLDALKEHRHQDTALAAIVRFLVHPV